MERIYIPSLLLDCDSVAAGSLDVEAAVTLEPRLGEGRVPGKNRPAVHQPHLPGR